jgi:alkylated DNA repair dioxygenase AlkB
MEPPKNLSYIADVFNERDRVDLMRVLQQTIEWRQEYLTIFGKTHPTPRLTAWYGDAHCIYKYSGHTCLPLPWTSELLSIKNQVEQFASGHKFNCVLLNYYRDGRDKMGWHADDEKELGHNPVIASVSFGATRRFDFKHKVKREEKFSLDLHSGSVLIMQGDLQHHWLHQLPAQKRIHEPRINLTFRNIPLIDPN